MNHASVGVIHYCGAFVRPKVDRAVTYRPNQPGVCARRLFEGDHAHLEAVCHDCYPYPYPTYPSYLPTGYGRDVVLLLP